VRADLLPELVIVTLSERNLKSLLVKLQQPSWRTIVSNHVYRADGTPLTNVLLVVRGEHDDVHYADREPPGPMHPNTEQALRLIDDSENSA
jgi:hypothetical protein